ncbi:hypothetical protein V5O48_005326 [Marasmius crinis-equi]|uniref:Uncharacterized protein n=1 Tax=Marasmius crinis-equi TaxID=585013 RepID=A0ABR3FMN3_9AGAR
MSYLSTPASSSSTRVLSGTMPGLLDPTQSQRLLRHPHSKLAFAFYDPRTTSTLPQPDPLQDLCKDRRVVLESLGNAVTWRLVPRALVDEGVTDEGLFPRVVNICGQLYECSQDQWDIHKLDNKYQCRVRLPPALSEITLATPPIQRTTEEASYLNGKRAKLAKDNGVMPRLVPRKKHNHDPPLNFQLSLSEDEQDESEVEEMIVDQHPVRSRSAAPSDRTKKKREQISRNRQIRRERVARRAEKLTQQDASVPSTSTSGSAPSDTSSIPPNSPIPPNVNPIPPSMDSASSNGDAHQDDASSPDSLVKRKVTSLFNPYKDLDYTNATEEDERNIIYYETTNKANSKRARTVSPTTAKRELGAKRHRREKVRQKKREEGIRSRRKRWYDEFMAQVYAEVPELREANNATSSNEAEVDGEDDEDTDSEDERQPESRDSAEADEDAIREAAIAESRRKLAELEKDRHLWEEEARKRALRERVEQEAEKLRREQLRFAEARQAEIERQRKAEEEEARKRQEMDPRMRQERVRMQREKYRYQPRAFQGWTSQRAIERYNQLCETFDSTKFSEDEPLVWEAVPWPLLTTPSFVRIGDIEFDAVEKFFTAAQMNMTAQQYRTFVVRSQHRFHPDRWSGRRLLRAVVDDDERQQIEAAADKVSKALTPIWEKATRRNQ